MARSIPAARAWPSERAACCGRQTPTIMIIHLTGDAAVDLELNDRLAIVTGGSRGIGKAIATELAKEGANVAIVARDLATTETAASDIAAKTGRPVYACL